MKICHLFFFSVSILILIFVFLTVEHFNFVIFLINVPILDGFFSMLYIFSNYFFKFYLYKSLKKFYYLVFRHRVSLCSPGCPAMCSGDQADLGFRDLPASVSPGLGWKAWATTPGFLPGELVGLNQHLGNSCRFKLGIRESVQV